MSGAHDHLYQQLFSPPELVPELLRGFVPQDWAQRVELDALERVNASDVGQHGAAAARWPARAAAAPALPARWRRCRERGQRAPTWPLPCSI
jgi:hypothetical protein